MTIRPLAARVPYSCCEMGKGHGDLPRVAGFVLVSLTSACWSISLEYDTQLMAHSIRQLGQEEVGLIYYDNDDGGMKWSSNLKRCPWNDCPPLQVSRPFIKRLPLSLVDISRLSVLASKTSIDDQHHQASEVSKYTMNI